MCSISPRNCSYCFIHSIPIDMKVPLESKSQIFFISFSLIVYGGRNKISSEIKFWIIAFIWARGKWTLSSRYEEGTRFFIKIQVCQTQWDHFQYKTLCFWWCIYSCYSLHSVKSPYILQSVSSGLKRLNTFADCCANEISDLGISTP